MKIYNTNQIKNIAIIGNSGSGKTSLAEAILFNSGVIDRLGDVNDKNTVSDYRDIEHENGISVTTTVLHSEWNKNKINIIDAPGADDFVGNINTAIQVSDLSLLLINAQNGVEVGTEIQLRNLEKYNKPFIVVINQLDNDKANFASSIEALKNSVGGNLILAQYPVETGENFNGIIDIITMKMIKFTDKGGKPEIVDIPDNEKDRAEELKNELIEKAAEGDDGLMELFFENETLTEDEMRKGITEGLIQRGMFPVFCISAKKNYGVTRLLDFISNVVPTPDQVPNLPTIDGSDVKIDPNGPASIFVFKTSVEEHVGEINYFKVMSGTISEGMDLINMNKQAKERLSQLFVVAGKNRTKVEKLVAGDFGATVKLKSTKTNHTLNASGTNWVFKDIEIPEPKYRTAIKPINEGDDEKLGEALDRIHQEDLSITVEYSKELKQIIVSGQGEYHLNIMKWYLDNLFKIDTEFLPPKIPYRETITKVAQADYRHKKQSGGAGQFGEVHMIIEPYVEGKADPSMFKIDGKEYKLSIRDKQEYDLDWGGKLIYYNCIVGGSIDARFLPAILKGIMEKMEEGPLTGSYARDIRVFIYDGKMHPVDSNEISFKLAGRNAFSMAFKNAGPKILEPIYDVEVFVPSDRMGDVMSDLQGRRAVVQGMSSEKGFEKISAKVPLAELGKYSTVLSSITGGKAMYSMKFAEYGQVPGDLQAELLKAYEKEQEEN